jgi:hypothetical protein
VWFILISTSFADPSEPICLNRNVVLFIVMKLESRYSIIRISQQKALIPVIKLKIVILKSLIDLVPVLISLQFFALTALVASCTAVALYHYAVVTCIIIYRFLGSHFLRT